MLLSSIIWLSFERCYKAIKKEVIIILELKKKKRKKKKSKF